MGMTLEVVHVIGARLVSMASVGSWTKTSEHADMCKHASAQRTTCPFMEPQGLLSLSIWLKYNPFLNARVGRKQADLEQAATGSYRCIVALTGFLQGPIVCPLGAAIAKAARHRGFEHHRRGIMGHVEAYAGAAFNS